MFSLYTVLYVTHSGIGITDLGEKVFIVLYCITDSVRNMGLKSLFTFLLPGSLSSTQQLEGCFDTSLISSSLQWKPAGYLAMFLRQGLCL